jgi:YVTN family beta-propeller protein
MKTHKSARTSPETRRRLVSELLVAGFLLTTTCIAGAGVPANTIVATIPAGIAISPDSTTVYVSNLGSDTVSVIDAATNTVTFTISVGGVPEGLAISSDGSTLYVACYESVYVISTASKTVITTASFTSNVDGSDLLTLTPDGSQLYYAHAWSIYVMDTTTNTISSTIDLSPVVDYAFLVVFTPDGSDAYIPSDNLSSTGPIYVGLTLVDTASQTVAFSKKCEKDDRHKNRRYQNW